ncbi:beta-1,6-N-acetylglucosaminyltransferase [Aerococcus viridans]|uniref:beta-1,6-N-acetylglucosaminyltransferase n=1 Tax=Aerococcus viridans TaxID=1377 RepID=UPI0002F434DE|nr:beta-1,6-N-acetylglucosaminyltransferase [Aerococcus viridans]
MNKHAYLILAHKNDFTFQTLLKSLDSPNNDLYIHMDKKVEDYDINTTNKLIKFSNIIHTKRTNVQWGGYSGINAEMILFEESYKSNIDYSFFHLISGEDLPIKPIEEIYKFFEKNLGKNFIRFQSLNFSYSYRVKYYYFTQDIFGRKKINSIINKISLKLQKIFRVNRNNNINFQKGTNWLSITRELVGYILINKKWIEETFKFSFCGDELFIQTLVFNSKFKETLYYNNYNNNLTSIMRYIDWDRGEPYVFQKRDFDDLVSKPYLFARKFDSKIDSEIIKMIYDYIK